MIGVEGVMGRVVRIWIGVLLIVDVILMLRDVELGIEISVLLGRDRMGNPITVSLENVVG